MHDETQRAEIHKPDLPFLIFLCICLGAGRIAMGI